MATKYIPAPVPLEVPALPEYLSREMRRLAGFISTISIEAGATDLSYDASTRVLASSTGADASLPLVTSTLAGLAPASGGGTSNFLRADGSWTAPSGVTDHGALTGLSDDDHTQYILVAGTRAFTGTQTTQALLPSATTTYDLGSAAARYRRVFATNLQGVRLSGGATFSGSAASANTMVYAQQSGGGAATVYAASPSNAASMTAGYAQGNSGGVAEFGSKTGSGHCVFGAALCDFGPAVASVVGNGQTNFVHGHAYSDGSFNATVDCGIFASGCFVQGVAYNGWESAQITSVDGLGSMARGYCFGGFFGAVQGLIDGGSYGSSAAGAVLDGGNILAYADGADSRGAVEDGTISVTAGATGASAEGFAAGSTITATAVAAKAGGSAQSGFAITASGTAAFAWGDATAAITASATNSVQFGPGVNAEANTLKIGTAGLRLKGTTGAPGTPVNGDIYMGGTGNAFVMVRSNGKAVQTNTGAAAWTTGAYATRRSFAGLTPTTNEVLELLETLVEELQAANIIN